MHCNQTKTFELLLLGQIRWFPSFNHWPLSSPRTTRVRKVIDFFSKYWINYHMYLNALYWKIFLALLCSVFADLFTYICNFFLTFSLNFKSITACLHTFCVILCTLLLTYAKVSAYPGELIKLVILSFDEQNYTTSDTIQILGTTDTMVSGNTKLCICAIIEYNPKWKKTLARENFFYKFGSTPKFLRIC